MCFPFCSLVMKIMIFKGVCPPKEGTILSRQRPIYLISLQRGKSHLLAKKAKKSPSKTPKSESSQHAIPSTQRSVTPTILEQTETAFLEPQSTSTQPRPFSSHLDRLKTLIKGLHKHISRLVNVIYLTNNHV